MSIALKYDAKVPWLMVKNEHNFALWLSQKDKFVPAFPVFATFYGIFTQRIE